MPETLVLQRRDLGAMIAVGRTAEVFALDAGRVIKLFLAGQPKGEALLEWQGLSAAASAGLPVPTPFALASVEGRHGIIMDEARGIPLLDALELSPETLPTVAALLASLHASIHEKRATTDLAPLQDSMRWAMERANVSSAIRDEGMRRLAQLPQGDRLCHMDFHPWQILVDGDPLEYMSVTIVDWLNARRDDPAADVARTALLLAVSPLSEPKLVWLDKGFHRSALAHHYVNHYCALTGCAPAQIEPWFYPLAVARRAEAINDNPALLTYLEAGVKGTKTSIMDIFL